jgi:CDP-diacylglycerol--serine O-phosphatidyltransferase
MPRRERRDRTERRVRPDRAERGERRRRRLRRGAYLLPSLFTIGNMLLGFYAVVLAFRGSQAVLDLELGDRYFARAALLIFIAAIVDTLDGRIARMTGTDSDFGREYDSLADLFTFGAAPALLTFLWDLRGLGRLGWLVPLCYMVCTATRLARFNVQAKVADTRYFVGLPSPAAAGAVCSLLFYVPAADGWRDAWAVFVLVTLFAVGALEVSTFRYWSPKQIDLRKRWSYRAALPLALIVLVVVLEPKAVFLVLGAVYALSGPVMWAVGRLRRKGAGPAGEQAPGEPGGGPGEGPLEVP